MLKNDILEKIFSHKEMIKIPVGTQATSVHVFEEVLEDILEVNPYAELQSLFVSTSKSIPV